MLPPPDRLTPPVAHPDQPRLSRRRLLGIGLGSLAGLGGFPARDARAEVGRPPIHARDEWARALPPTRGLASEAPGDVRFLLVHHAESPNTERPGSIPERLRGFYRFHTTGKGWADVAYNFFVDPFGEIWEGRTGSLAGPVRGDATGGSQGFAQLCCFVGDHGKVPPTEAALAAMSALLAWLAQRYAIDLYAGRAITFVSRGSNRWPQGTTVTTDPIAGHRDMSETECPGDALYPLVRSRLLPGAQRLISAAAAGTTQPPARADGTTAAPASPSPSPPVDSAPDASVSGVPASTAVGGSSAGVDPLLLSGAAGITIAGAAATAIGITRRRSEGSHDH